MHLMSTYELLSQFFNNHHDKLLCTANSKGEPNIALMGTPRLVAEGIIEFEISDPVSVSLQNIMENKAVVFMAYLPGARARDYHGARISATVTEIETAGEKFEKSKTRIREKHGEEKAQELLAIVTCQIVKVRPVVDRGQQWHEPAY